MIKDDHILWVERYRPRTVKDCILPDELKVPFQTYVNMKQVPNLILTGRAGTGKTTIAKAMCEEIGIDYVMLNGSEERGIDTLRTKVKDYAATMSMKGEDGRKVVIVDEADGLTNAAQEAFRGVIEEFEKNCTFIFTCNRIDQIIEPLKSRMTTIAFTIKEDQRLAMMGGFFKRVGFILNTEGVKHDRRIVGEVVKKHFPDFRKTLNDLQHYSVTGELSPNILSKVTDVTYTELFGFIKSKNYAGLRKWVAVNSDTDSTALMRGIYDKLSEHMTEKSIPMAIVLLGKYQYQAAFAVDKEINTMAFLTEVLVECEVK